MADVIIALDQGTTSSRAIAFDRNGCARASASLPLPQHYPRPGWVEHDPEALWSTTLQAARAVLQEAAAQGHTPVAIGLTNQRETTLIWDRRSGAPVHHAIVWQDRRTADLCEQLRVAGLEPDICARTGLVIDPYFSATKLVWLLTHVPGLRERAARGELAFGTVDTWLLYRLTGGRLHATDVSNASRTMLFDIHRLAWDADILAELRIPASLLPAVLPSSHQYAVSDPAAFGVALPIAGIAGDQQAATFGQACFQAGMAKQTYGTGSFMLLNTGARPVPSSSGLLTTIAWSLDGRVTYALEGSSFVAGAAVQWLRDELGIITTAAESESLAASVPHTGGVYFVPAFAGLGAPWWDASARGALLGLTRGAGRAEIARAVLESVAYQTRDLLDAMRADAGADLPELRVDGGMVANAFLLQFQADILGRRVVRPAVTETTALGAAYLAGLAVGLWHDLDDIGRNWQVDRSFDPALDPAAREHLYAGWRRAVARAREWEVAP